MWGVGAVVLGAVGGGVVAQLRPHAARDGTEYILHLVPQGGDRVVHHLFADAIHIAVVPVVVTAVVVGVMCAGRRLISECIRC